MPVIYTGRVDHDLGTAAITTRLARDDARYPPPVARRTGKARRWSAQTVRSILDNPAYLGYVMPGRTRHGQPLPPTSWLWSPGPARTALAGLDLWWAAHHRLRPKTLPTHADPPDSTHRTWRWSA